MSPFLLDAMSDALACVLKSFYLQTNRIKESIRMGYNDLGDFHYAQGHLSDAFKSYIRTRDYCTTSKHVVQMCLNVILVSIELGQFMHVSNYVIKAEQTPDDMDPITAAKLRAAAGLAYMETNKYKLAARKVNALESLLLVIVSILVFRVATSDYQGFMKHTHFNLLELCTVPLYWLE